MTSTEAALPENEFGDAWDIVRKMIQDSNVRSPTIHINIKNVSIYIAWSSAIENTSHMELAIKSQSVSMMRGSHA